MTNAELSANARSCTPGMRKRQRIRKASMTECTTVGDSYAFLSPIRVTLAARMIGQQIAIAITLQLVPKWPRM